MEKIEPKVILLIVLALFISCSTSNQEEQRLLDDAYAKQAEAIELIVELKEKLKTSTNPQKDSLLEVIEELEESLIAIPGYALNLPGHEGHDHGHAKVEQSAEEIYKVQEEILKQLNQIQKTIKNQ